MSSHSSPPPPPPSTAAAKKPQPIPWTQQETLQLILIYQHKWHSSNRRHLRAPQWEEVAAAVAARCGHDDPLASPEAKSGTQCRHKMEKLRRRYRSELPRASSSNWPYFSLMDSLERGPISARPLSEYHGEPEQDDDEEEEDEEAEVEDYEAAYNNNKLRSINHILRKPSVVNRFPGKNYSGFLLPAAAEGRGGGKRKRGEDEGNEEGIGLVLVDEVKKLIEKMKGVERKKMEMVKETERWRMEMERQRMEMMLASQRKILHLIASSSSASDDDGDG